MSIKRILLRLLEIVCVIMFALITVIGSYQIVTRFVFNSPSTMSEELLTYSFTWLSLLAASMVFGRREHMRMGFLADKLKGSAKKAADIFSEALVVLFSVLVMIYGGASITRLTATQVTASLGVPMSVVYAIVPVCGAFVLIFGVINILEIIAEGDEM